MASASVRWIRRIILLAVLGVGGWYGWEWYHGKTASPPEYRTAKVERADISHSVTATGELKAGVLVQVGSQISGTISKLNADFNSHVKKGEIVAQIDPRTYQANLAQAEGELANARAEVELARVNEERKKQLRAKDLAPVADYDKARADLLQAEARLKIRTAAIEKNRIDLERCTIYSPIDGIVISRKVDVGQTVAASLNAPVLFEIANDLSQMEIHANVGEADIGEVAEGQDVEFEVRAFYPRIFHGRVRQVRNAPTILENVVTYVSVIDVNNADLKLKPGMTGEVKIILAREKDAISVPNAALRFRPETPGGEGGGRGQSGGRDGGGRDGGGREGRGGGGGGGGGDRRREAAAEGKATVYKLGAAKSAEGGPELVPVEIRIGITDDLRTVVLEGLSDGDDLVTGQIVKESSFTTPADNPFGGGRRRF